VATNVAPLAFLLALALYRIRSSLTGQDVVIMAGRPIQFMYDHRVIPRGLRVAATARVIG
jgi:hypothetical protein